MSAKKEQPKGKVKKVRTYPANGTFKNVALIPKRELCKDDLNYMKDMCYKKNRTCPSNGISQISRLQNCDKIKLKKILTEANKACDNQINAIKATTAIFKKVISFCKKNGIDHLSLLSDSSLRPSH
jgi:hypothetical protein